MLARLALILVVAAAACDSPGDGVGQPVADVWSDTGADAKAWEPDPECAEDYDCTYYGACDWDAAKSKCVETEDGCAQSDGCAEAGLCIVGRDGLCAATKESCACSARCKDEGYCLLDPGFGICTFGGPQANCPVTSD